MTRALARRGVAGWRAAALAGTLLALLAGYLTATVISASAADPLLSQGRPATASSTESAGTPASAAVDGNPGTRWSSAFSDPQWIRVDLGSTATISRVVLTWEGAYARAFTIQTSADGTAWTTVHTTTAGTGGTQDLAVTGTGRYVRLHATARATGWGVSLWEFQVYGTTGSGGCGTANAAQGRPATASSVQSAGFPATAAVDGNPGTRWSSAAADPQWLRVDLGTSQAICGVTLVWEAAYATAFQVQTSPDGTAWTTVHTATGGTGGTQALSVSGTGRYVRMLGTQRATPYGYSLWEFQVHTGAGHPPPSPVARARPRAPSTSPSPGGPEVLLSYGKPAFASSSQNDGALLRLPAGAGVRQRPGEPLGDERHDRLGRPRLDLRRPGRHRRDPAGRPAMGSRVRHRVPDPGLRRCQHVDERSTRPRPAAASRRR